MEKHQTKKTVGVRRKVPLRVACCKIKESTKNGQAHKRDEDIGGLEEYYSLTQSTELLHAVANR